MRVKPFLKLVIVVLAVLVGIRLILGSINIYHDYIGLYAEDERLSQTVLWGDSASAITDAQVRNIEAHANFRRTFPIVGGPLARSYENAHDLDELRKKAETYRDLEARIKRTHEYVVEMETRAGGR